MAILVDPPRWPAHGTMWAHLVSDVSLEELHAFAAAVRLSPRSFDLDHYDVPADRVDELVAAGAQLISGRELLERLRRSGLRVPGADRRAERRRRRRARLAGEWAALGREVLAGAVPDVPGDGAPPDAHEARPDETWRALGQELLDRWSEPHRRYHDLAHLEEVLDRLTELARHGEPVTAAVRLAAWFHDAVYAGEPGRDEEESAELARRRLTGVGAGGATVAEVVRLVRLTASHAVEDDPPGAALCDADLAILAAPPRRYARYAADVRAEYAHVPEEDFRAGRGTVLQSLIGRERLFATASGRYLWEERARSNLAAELRDLTT